MSGFVTRHGEDVTWDENDPASIEAWFGPFGHAEHFRKVVLATAYESERAKAETNGEKASEARLNNLARTSDLYVQYLIDTLNARTLRNKSAIEALAR